MGIENNEAVLATTYDDKIVEDIQAWAEGKACAELLAFIPSIVNSKTTIVLAPSGSKKGWDTNLIAESFRDAFIAKLEGYKYEDGSSPINWIEVGYGEFGQTILRGNCVNCYNNLPYAEPPEE